jgi:hypothetical protein
MSLSGKPEKELASEVRVVVEVDGSPVGFLNLDVDRLWPMISHRERDKPPVDWIDAKRYDEMLRAAAVKGLIRGLSPYLYRALGDEIVRAQLNLETLTLKSEMAAQVFGRTKQEIEQLTAQSGRTLKDFYEFFWDYLLEDKEVTDGAQLKKAWEAGKKV